MRRGLVIVNTGDGKGKTTAALGALFRAWGRDLRVAVIQFIKAETGNWGEIRAARKLGIDWRTMGDGFTNRSRDLDKSADKARLAWQAAQEEITSGTRDLIVLDEMTHVFSQGWLDAGEVIAWLKEHKPDDLHLIITGRDAPAALIDYADLVTEMREIKHPYHSGVKAQPGIEF